jgi:hypothetical protein
MPEGWPTASIAGLLLLKLSGIFSLGDRGAYGQWRPLASGSL